MSTDEQKKQILNDFFEVIGGISNREYQKRVWILGEGPECDDFTETTCYFFDDGEPILNNYKDYGITEDQFKKLLNFYKLYEAFVYGDRPYLAQDFIDTDEWKIITERAKEILESFNYKGKLPGYNAAKKA